MDHQRLWVHHTQLYTSIWSPGRNRTSSRYCCHLMNPLLHGERESDQRKSTEWRGASEKDNLQFLYPHPAFLHLHRTPPLSPLALLSYLLLPPSLLLLPCLSPVPSLLALVSRARQNQSPGYPEGKRRGLGTRNDCPGLYPAHCSDCCCYWPGSLQLNSCCPGIGRLRCHSHAIGWQLRLEVGRWKEPSCQLSVLMLEGLG